MRIISGGLVLLALIGTGCGSAPRPITVGSENTAEQQILGELITLWLEKRLPGTTVTHNRAMGDVMVVQGAIQSGAIDIYAEDAGTALSQVLREEVPAEPEVAVERLRTQLRAASGLAVLDPLGIAHQFVIFAAPGQKGDELSAAGDPDHPWKIGGAHGFIDRQDGLGLLTVKYRVRQRELAKAVDAQRMPDALRGGMVNLAAVYSTDALASLESEFPRLRDDQSVYPAYPVCVIAKAKTLAEHKGLEQALRGMAGKLTNAQLRDMVVSVELKQKVAHDVAVAFAATAGW